MQGWKCGDEKAGDEKSRDENVGMKMWGWKCENEKSGDELSGDEKSGTLAYPIRGLTVFSNNNMYLNGPIFFSDQTLLLLVLGSWLLYFSPLQRSDASGVHCIKSLSGAAQSISPNQAQQRAVVTNFFVFCKNPLSESCILGL